tara:strand:- start:6126 stop:6875 length:750 start_codon:yes stop_codon:yes gene_type:complete
MNAGVLLYCFNTESYRYDKIAAKTVPLLKKNLKLPITIVTNMETFKELPPLGMINYKIIEHEKGNKIDNKPWHNLDRWRAYSISPYDKTILLDIDYFCYTNSLLELLDVDEDFLVHDKVYDLTGRNAYTFREKSAIPMVWATCIVFNKSKKAQEIFDMVGYIKRHYPYFCSLYRIDFRNFRNDYAFAIALQQLGGFTGYNTLPTRLPTLPANAVVKEFSDTHIKWEMEGRSGVIENTDVHVIDKGVAYV